MEKRSTKVFLFFDSDAERGNFDFEVDFFSNAFFLLASIGVA